MQLGRSKNLRKLESCGLFWTGGKEPIDLIAKTLRGNGLRVGKIDRAHCRIAAKTPPSKRSGSCRINLQVFPQAEVCLVMATLEGPRSGDEEATLDCLLKLRSCLDNVRLEDEAGVLDWKRRIAQRPVVGGRGSSSLMTAPEAKSGRA